MTNNDIVKQENRILYVEPNDLYGYVDGVPMTPDYSDYCISVNLIAEVVSRFKQSGEDATKNFIMTWTTRPGVDSDGKELVANNWISFLQGEDARLYGGNGNVLTTYYTDINYDDIVKKNIVEGIGIDSIQVSFESYYTPTVVIKFIDVRGASLFGREESVHDNGEDLSSSSIFGVFFTVPYPKFKLQIKGFYGHAVTYQLTCSDFRASFNSQTGNFEAVATFIGYSYSLLTDIPLRYLVAAPYCEYIGRSYWDSKLHSPEWALSDGNTPQTLFRIIEKVKSLLTNTDEVKKKLMSDDDANRKTNIETEKSLLSELSIALKAYVESFKKLNKTTQSQLIEGDNDEEQLVIFAPAPDTDGVPFKIAQVGDEMELTSTQLIDAFDKYNDSYREKAFSDSLLPNGKHGAFRKYDSLEFARLCQVRGVVKNDEGKITSVTFNCAEQSENGLTGIPLNNNNKLIRGMAKQLLTDAHKENGMIPGYFGEFCYVVNLNKFLKKINARIKELNVEDKEIDKKVAEKVQTAAAFVLHFTPYIGDIFKIIMCHLETFIHMMWGCYRIIDDDMKNGKRTPDVLGIDLKKTDIALPSGKNSNNVFPWPGVFNNGSTTDDGGDEDKSIESLAWIGDFSHNFEEEKLVVELYKAAQIVAEISESDPQPVTFLTGVPVMPNDLNNMPSVFSADIKNGISGLSGYLSFRAAQIFGVLMNTDATPELARTIGIMDAYNYFGYNQSRSDIKNTLLEPTSNKGTLADIMFAVSHCEKPAEDGFYGVEYQESGRSVHDFETVRSISYQLNGQKKSIERHPMFIKNGSNSKYVHYYMKNWTGLVPDVMKSYDSYKDTFETFGSKDNTYFMFKKNQSETNAVDANGFLHKSNTKVLFEGLGDEYSSDDYINNDMFDVNINDAFSESVINKYNELKSGTFKILGDTFNEDLSTVLEKFWHVSNEDYGKYFGDNSFMLSATAADRGIEQKELYPKTSTDANNNDNAVISVDNSKIFDITGGGIKYDASKNSWIDEKGNEKPISNLCVRFFQSNYLNGSSSDYESLFASQFYYHQNDIVTKTNDEKTDENVMKSRQLKVKALLFLHSLKYDYKKVAEFLNPDKKNGGIYSVPYGYMLLLGGLLWREKYYRMNGIDPIQTSADNGNCYCNKYNAANDKLEKTACKNEFKEVKRDFTLFREIDGKYVLCPLRNSDGDVNYNVRVSQLFGMGNSSAWMPDQYVTNSLIKLFNNFIPEWGKKLINELELKDTIRFKNNDRKTIAYTGETFKIESSVFINDFKKDKNPLNMLARLREQQRYFSNFFGNYRFLSVNKSDHILMLLNDENTEVQNSLKDIYTRRVIVTDSSGIRHIYNGDNAIKDIEINSDVFKSYLQGFESKITEIASNERAGVVNEYGGDDVTLKKDLLLPIYLYLKMIWDKWLVSTTTKQKNNININYEDYYNVENFFKSFIFIDSFYKNIYKKFIINLETLKNSYVGRDEDGSLFQFIGDITSKHNCLFLALPDYVDMGNADNTKAKESLMNMFKPIPYNKMNGVDDENRFVIIYTPRMSEIPSSMNGYKEDYFRIWNPVTNRWDDKAGEMFSLGPINNNASPVTRYGYYVPSFGVAFSRQNNHLFKNISLNMTTPLVTSASINAIANIAKKGAGGQNKAAFIGQDLYPVFSNYSYICEIEMMGDAQIQPLMYFQLMNIPMWSGVYMIFNVTHTITAGNMATKFKGMKLSRNPLPYNSSWYMFRPENYDDEIGEQGNYTGQTEGSIEEFGNNDSTKLRLVLNRTELTPRYTMGKLYIDGEFFCDVVEDTVRNISKGNCSKKIDHETAIPYGTYQVSVNIPSKKFDSSADYKAVCGNYHVPMVMDVPCFSGIRIHKGNSASSSWGCLIVGNKSTTEAGRVVNSEEVFKKLFPILRKAEIDDKKKIEITIVNTNDYGRFVNSNIKDAVASNLNNSNLKNIAYVRQRLKDEFGLTDNQFSGIAGNFVQESRFDPKAEEFPGKTKGGKGLAQWTASRRVAAEKYLGVPIVQAPLSRQVDYLIYELKNTEKSTIPAVKNTVSVADAVVAFEKKYERAGKPVYDKRIKYGNLVKQYIEGGVIS